MTEAYQISFLPFPQRWDVNHNLHLSVLVLPKGSPIDTIAGGGELTFATTALKLEAVVIPGLDEMPAKNQTAAVVFPVSIPPVEPLELRSTLFHALSLRTTIVNKPLSDKPIQTIKKALPQSYMDAFTFERPRTLNAVVGDEFACRMRSATPPPVKKGDPAPSNEASWGEVISLVLRQPVLARQLGLIYDIQLAAPASGPQSLPVLLAKGGWIYLDYDHNAASAPFVSLCQNKLINLSLYAARIPALKSTQARHLFAAVLFPVMDPQSQAAIDSKLLDQIGVEAMEYDDGFAHIVHCQQPATGNAATDASHLPPATEAGIQIGWDDEQVVTWQNRQLEIVHQRSLGTGSIPETPLGVMGYRVDIRQEGGAWKSLTACSGSVCFKRKTGTPEHIHIETIIDIPFTNEAWIEPASAKMIVPGLTDVEENWLPQYFAQWQGKSLIGKDKTMAQFSRLDWVEPQITAIPPDDIRLAYGQKYSFRTRLADLSGGGPALTDLPINPAPAPTTAHQFLRYVPPKAVQIVSKEVEKTSGPHPLQPVEAIGAITTLVVKRPLLGYPEFSYTRIFDGDAGQTILNNTIAKLLSQMDKEFEEHKRSITPQGIPDPDVKTLRISVQVKTLGHDSSLKNSDDYQEIYSIEHDFAELHPETPLEEEALRIEIEYKACIDIKLLKNELEPNSLKLIIPTARDVRVQLTPLCEDKPHYYGAENVRTGLVAEVKLRQETPLESDFWVENIPQEQLKAFFFQPSLDDPVSHLAQQLSLISNNLTLSGRPGDRVVFGVGRGLTHQLEGDASTITFSSLTHLTQQWIVAICLEVNRDWTWDGLAGKGISFNRRKANGIHLSRVYETQGKSKQKLGQESHLNSGLAAGKRLNIEFEAAFPDIQYEPIGTVHLPHFLGETVNQAGSENERTKTRVIFFDVISPHLAEGNHPQEIWAGWKIYPTFRKKFITKVTEAELDSNAVHLEIKLPTTIPPNQVPKIVSAGLALSAYKSSPDYASTLPRQRGLWVEFERPLDNPDDTYYCRVLGYGPDPMLSLVTALPLIPIGAGIPALPDSSDPSLPLDPEEMRMISPEMFDDHAGSQAMVPMVRALDSACHFLLPLPPGLTPDSPELFGFWTYEFRVGHNTVWSTAQGRFGRPIKVTGIQHPAPPLVCQAGRRPKPVKSNPITGVWVTVPFATPVWQGLNLLQTGLTGESEFSIRVAGDSKPSLGIDLDHPLTEIWVQLYAQVMQADGETHRNILLARRQAEIMNASEEIIVVQPGKQGQKYIVKSSLRKGVEKNFGIHRRDDLEITLPSGQEIFSPRDKSRGLMGKVFFTEEEIRGILNSLGLPVDAPLSVLAVEFMPRGKSTPPDPIQKGLGFQRILRTSPLTSVPLSC